MPARAIDGREELLLYVGISPSRATSSQNLRKRLITHATGNIGSSTFRMSLAALLFEAQGWRPVWRRDRPLLSAADNDALSAWQGQHLRVGWAQHTEPWAVEHDVIDNLQAPMNLAGNGGHPFHRAMSEARRAFRSAARQGRERR